MKPMLFFFFYFYLPGRNWVLTVKYVDNIKFIYKFLLNVMMCKYQQISSRVLLFSELVKMVYKQLINNFN